MRDSEARSIAGQVARYLPGAGWAPDAAWDGYGAILAGPDGARLHLTGPRDGKIHVSGCLPVTSLRVTAGGINVGASRPPAAIAAEVGRRLLPAYRAALAEIREQDAIERAAQLARAALADQITGLFPAGAAAMPSHCQSSSRSEIVLHLGEAAGGWVKFYGRGHEVELDRMRVPAAVAVEMLAVLAGSNRQEATP